MCRIANAELSVSESEGGGPSTDDLVNSIVDPNSDYTLVAGSVSRAINTASGSYTSSLRAIGEFSGGSTPEGTLMPAANQNANGDAEYSGGIGMSSGVILCTGAGSDSDIAGQSLGPERGVGAEGPNNGALGANPGEVGVTVLGEEIIDQDFNQHVFNGATPALSGDPTVLQFKITLQSPGYLRLTCIFASDEYPHWTTEFNDSFAVLIKKDACATTPFNNIAVLKSPQNPNPEPFTLAKVVACQAPTFRQNQLAPSPSVFVGPPPAEASKHAIDDTPGAAPFEYDTSVPYFDHEYGGFTRALTFETRTALSVGTYTVKLVIHDVGDANVDSALFIGPESLKLLAMNPADYDGDGCVTTSDYVVFSKNFGKSPANFFDGDGDGDCLVSSNDYMLFLQHFGEGGNARYPADFNADGCVDTADYVVWAKWNGLLDECATRFEGDADADGDVDQADHTKWSQWFGSCGWCGQGQGAMAASSGPSLKELLPQNPDVNGDGTVDRVDIDAIDAIVAEWANENGIDLESEATAEDEGPAPTLAEPEPTTSPSGTAPQPRPHSAL
jgi:hypothetical protein